MSGSFASRWWNPLGTCENKSGLQDNLFDDDTLFFDPSRYIVEIKNSALPGQSPIFRTSEHPHELMVSTNEAIKTGFDVFQHGKAASNDGPCLGRRVRDATGVLTNDLEWFDYSTVEAMASNVGSGLLGLECVEPRYFAEEHYENAREMKLLGVLSVNRVEWFVLEQTAHMFTIALVPLYDTLGGDAMEHIINHGELTTVVCGGKSLTQILAVKPKCPHLKHVIVFDMPFVDQFDSTLLAVGAELGVSILKYSDVIKFGAANPVPQQLPNAHDIWTICYTSGTSGPPKGVLLSHGNLVANCCAAAVGVLSGKFLRITNDDIHVSFLTMAHVYERIMSTMFLFHGCRIAAFSGNVLRLAEDLKVVQPTLFLAVPRLFNRIHDKILAEVASKSTLAQSVFNVALAAKIRRLKKNGTVTHTVWDSLMFNTVKHAIGGKVKFMLSAGAPLDPLVGARLKCLLCAPLMEGYGMTETVGTSFISNPFDPTQGHVGRPQSCLEFRLESIPEMNYFANGTPRKGELLIRGPAVFKGYFKDKENTDDVMDSHGWLHTGDVATLLANGALQIIDRKKNIFKLAQGEYVSPEKIENAYIQAPLVSQAFVFGYSIKNFLVCIIVPDEEAAQRWASAENKPLAVDRLIVDEEFTQTIRTQLEEAGKTTGLKGFERAKVFRLTLTPFTVENGLITPSMKIKRHIARDRFKAEIDQMYAEEEGKTVVNFKTGI